MNIEKLKTILITYNRFLRTLAEKKIFIITDFNKGGLLWDEKILDKNASLLGDNDEEIIHELFNSNYLKNYSIPTIINILKFIELFKQLRLGEEKNIESNIELSFLLSRVSFMGTDGIRGKINATPSNDFLSDFLNNGILSSELVFTITYSFCELLIEEKILTQGDKVAICEDGRDIVTEKTLYNALIKAFSCFGMCIHSLNILPTPFLPYYMLKNSIKAGAVLTASHNPSNQNGVKFFLYGKKLLPEDKIGDYTISAYLYKNYLNYNKIKSKLNDLKISSVININFEEESIKFLCDLVLKESTNDLFKDLVIVLDSANGAFSNISQKVLQNFNIEYIPVNCDNKGYNINQNGGVAELEGHSEFEYSEDNLLAVKQIFELGKKSKKQVFGIVLDGDGDRGFLLLYYKDKVYVLDGDKCGYILVGYLLQSKNIKKQEEYFYVTTVESNIMAPHSINKDFKVNIDIVSVGDKWIGNFSKGKLLLGVENSGHVIIPIEITDKDSKKHELRTGNGLLTALYTIIAIKKLNLSFDKVISPFKPMITKTYYTYFVDKNKFYKDSKVWKEDLTIINNKISEINLKKQFWAEINVKIEDKEDKNMLYINFYLNKEIIGCIFVRNSGTEDKIATYIQTADFTSSFLLDLGKEINQNHKNLMKKKNSREYLIESKILEVLELKDKVDKETLKQNVNKLLGENLSTLEFEGILYGLKKEGTILISKNMISKKEDLYI